jgi:hypothetical protein
MYLKFSVSRLLFISGLAATIAPWLGSGVCTIWVYRVGRRLLQDTDNAKLDELPTSREFAHLISLSAASLQRLVQYLWYARHATYQPRVLRRASGIAGLTFLFAGTIIISDISLHYTARSKVLGEAKLPGLSGDHSLRISDACMHLNRTDNAGFSCARNFLLWSENPQDYTDQQSRIINLSHNVSETVTVRIEGGQGASKPGTAIIVPKSETIPVGRDFRASTLGVRTECSLRTTECGFWTTGWQGTNQWAFNCSDTFFGVLGKQPRTAWDPLDPDQPPLTYKPTNQLQLGYFTDPELTTLYNPQGANASGQMPDAPIAMPNDELINPVYVGIAARFPLSMMSPDADFATSDQFYNGTGGWYGFALSCAYSIYDVQYTWSNGSVLNMTSTLSPNGTFAEIYQGWHAPGQTNQLDLNLQDAMVQATMESNSAGLLKKWSELYSIQVMSVIGAVMVPAPSILEQQQGVILVAQVAIPPLALIIIGCIGYTAFGLIVVLSAFRATQEDISDIPSLLSTEGLALWAVRQDRSKTEGSEASLHDVWNTFGIDSDQGVTFSASESKVGVFTSPYGHAIQVFGQGADAQTLQTSTSRRVERKDPVLRVAETSTIYPRGQSSDNNTTLWI